MENLLAHLSRRGALSASLAGLLGLFARDAEAGKSAKKKRVKKKRQAQKRVDACFVTLNDVCNGYTGDIYLFCTDLVRDCCPRAASSFDAVCFCIDGTPCRASGDVSSASIANR